MTMTSWSRRAAPSNPAPPSGSWWRARKPWCRSNVLPTSNLPSTEEVEPMCRRLIALLLLVSLAGAAQAQESTLADAADELRFLAEERPVETVTLRIDGDNREF